MPSGSGAVIVVPTYQEAANLPRLAAGIHTALPDARGLVVDDASGDGTPEWARGHEGFGTWLFLLERPCKSGFASALTAGYHWAAEHGAELVGQIDADFSHDPTDLPRLLAAVEAGADLAIGSRYCPGGRIENWTRWRRILSRAAGCYVTASSLSDLELGPLR